jgi:hypothetical protein
MAAATLLRLYAACHYDVRLPGGRRATLRVGQPLPAPLAEWLADAPFAAFITAYNPRSQPQPAAHNRAALRTLLREIRGVAGARLLPGVGHLPGQRWREPSLLVAGLALTAVDALACRHSQNAIVLAHRNAATQLRGYGDLGSSA